MAVLTTDAAYTPALDDLVDESGVQLTDDLPGPDLSISGATGAPARLPRGQVYHPDGWFFVR